MFPQERGSRAFEMPTVPKKNTTDQGIGPTGVAKTPLFGLYRPISDVMKKNDLANLTEWVLLLDGHLESIHLFKPKLSSV